eukprot:m.98629 g.98629  ORF g.98629 m.98629 type:complete len:346 (+) comp13642_c0_seq4:247-1284(+)
MSSAQSHYDRQAGEYGGRRTLEQAQQARSKQRTHALKTFHNKVKRTMIQRLSHRNKSLLDLACGRGGDIRKWIDNKVENVLGVDISKHEVEEAKYRLGLHLAKTRNPDLFDYRFVQTTDIGVKEIDWNELEPKYPKGFQFDSVSCHFAAHYFFKSYESVKAFLSNVSRSLKPGGVFYGVVADGSEILRRLENRPEYKSELLNIQQKWTEQYKEYGSGYTFAISGTVTNDDHEKDEVGEGCLEYLVFLRKFTEVAKKFNLHPADLNWEKDFEGVFRSEPQKSSSGRERFLAFHRLNPNYGHDSADAEELTKISHLYSGFVFRKASKRKRDAEQDGATEARKQSKVE